MPYMWEGAARGLSQGIMAAMERRLQREREQEEREWRQQQLELQNQPIDVSPLLQAAGRQVDGPLYVPREFASAFGTQWAQSMFAPEPAQTPILTPEMAESMGVPHLSGLPISSLPDIGTFVEKQAGADHRREETKHIGAKADAEIRRALASAGLDDARSKEISSTLEHAISNLRADADLKQATVERIGSEIKKIDAETGRIWELLPHEERQMIVANLQAEHDLAMDQEYEGRERLADIQHTLARTDRERIGAKMDEIDRQYLEATLADRVTKSMQERQLVEIQLDQANTALQQAEFQLALARRVGGYEEQRAALEVQRLEQQINQLRAQTQMLEQESAALQSIGTNDPEALRRLYELDSKQFRDAGLWVPTFQEYQEFVRRGGGDWASEVQRYNEATTSLLGPARDDDRGLSARDHMNLARAMYDARYWLGGSSAPTFDEFLWSEYWPSYETMQYLMDPSAFADEEYEFDPVAEATLFLGAVDGDVNDAIRLFEENIGRAIQAGSITQEQAAMVRDVLERERAARGESDEEGGFLRTILRFLRRE